MEREIEVKVLGVDLHAMEEKLSLAAAQKLAMKNKRLSSSIPTFIRFQKISVTYVYVKHERTGRSREYARLKRKSE